jgi:hypothetical protein
MKPEGPLPCSQEPFFGPNSEQHESSPQLSTPFFETHFILSYSKYLDLLSGAIFHRIFLRTLYTHSFPPVLVTYHVIHPCRVLYSGMWRRVADRSSLTFRKNVLSPSSGPKTKAINQGEQTVSRVPLQTNEASLYAISSIFRLHPFRHACSDQHTLLKPLSIPAIFPA